MEIKNKVAVIRGRGWGIMEERRGRVVKDHFKGPMNRATECRTEGGSLGWLGWG